MDLARLLSLTFSLGLLAGCAGTPGRMEKVATISNQAEAQYAYSGSARFAVFSETIEVSIYAPYGHLLIKNEGGVAVEKAHPPKERASEARPTNVQKEAFPGTKDDSNAPSNRDASSKNAEIAGTSIPQQKEGSRQANISGTNQGSARRESIAQSGTSQITSQPSAQVRIQQPLLREAPATASQKEDAATPSGNEKGQSAQTRASAEAAKGQTTAETSSTRAGSQTASTQTADATGKTQESLAAMNERGSVAGNIVLAKNQAARQGEQLHAEAVKDVVVASGTKQIALNAQSHSFEREPLLHKDSSVTNASVGERFEYILDFQNPTPLDLSALNIIDPLDARLSPLLDKIRLDPALKHTATLESGRLLVMIPDGLKRGKHVRVFVPVVFAAPNP